VKKRILSALILVPLVVYLVVWADLFYVKLAVLLVAGLGYSEWLGLDSKEFHVRKAVYLSCFFALGFVFLFFNHLFLLALFLCLVFHLILGFPSLNDGSFLREQYYFVGLLYLSLYLFAIPLMQFPSGRLLLLTLFVSIWSGDTFAYFCGKGFGKVKLAPIISPKKTVEGAICGIVGGTLVGVIFGMLLKLEFLDVFLVAFVSNIFGILGDLAESVPKRFFGKKDSSNLIPGHGGILDRLDSFAFAVFFSYLVLLCKSWLF